MVKGLEFEVIAASASFFGGAFCFVQNGLEVRQAPLRQLRRRWVTHIVPLHHRGGAPSKDGHHMLDVKPTAQPPDLLHHVVGHALWVLADSRYQCSDWAAAVRGRGVTYDSPAVVRRWRMGWVRMTKLSPA
eukprot:CAMPEP_0181365666 /NCGR_PEP_ID=MMETSP1106-20121128/10214_1 /TAXON_ID=81844 /ORGANISM="Mantoniella antarctica, Strain SL-175" /LENGTH=130 /DNA_ID=CAMNT_0023480807 /DNA_START=52 /DNA_END=441 /DNA_ORIENTATION=+